MILVSKKKINNYGYTLVELIVVIAVMGVLVGGMSMGVSLLFSKDAHKCATKLNDAIYTTRMNSMTKAGEHSLIVDGSGAINSATMKCTGVTPPVSDINIYLDESSSEKKTDISVKFVTESNPTGEDVSLPVTVKFNKSKGNVEFDCDGDGNSDDGILVFNVESKRGTRHSKVQLVTTTGKHTIGDFE